MKKYHFITVEGNTGAGKTSLARLLAKEYQADLVLETFAENPYLPKQYANKRADAFQNEVFFLVDRQEQLKPLLQQHAFQKDLTISDYFWHKSLLYAKVNLTPEAYQLFERLFYAFYPPQSLPQPELIIYIHASVPRLLQNIKQRGRNFEQTVDPNYLQAVADRYFHYFIANPQLKILFIHADQLDFVHNSKDYYQILDWINQDYSVGIHEKPTDVIHSYFPIIPTK